MIDWEIEYRYNNQSKKTTKMLNLPTDKVNYINDNILCEEFTLQEILEWSELDNVIGIKINKSRYDTKSEEGYIYKITNIITGKCYIGRSINPISRIYNHIDKSSSASLCRDIKKYGLIHFTFKCWLCKDYKMEETRLINENGLENLYNKK